MKNKKNMGFSLVELIVVIAIMAVLVGVLAPAYLQYVEKSRKSSDISALSEIMGAAEKVAIDPEFHLTEGDKFVIEIKGGVAELKTGEGEEEEGEPSTDDGEVTVLEAWQELASAEKYTLKSSAFSAVTVDLIGTVTAAGGVDWTYKGDEKGVLIGFSSDFEAKFKTTTTTKPE